MTAPVQPGEVLAGKYRVERVLGVGGMGVVVAAMHVHLDQRVALKFSPEQLKASRDVDARTDVWALGIVLHELLTGECAFISKALPELLMEILQTPPQTLRSRRPDYPPGLEAIILRCLEKEPGRRYSSAAELAVALGEFAPPRARVSLDRVSKIFATPEPWARWTGSRLPRWHTRRACSRRTAHRSRPRGRGATAGTTYERDSPSWSRAKQDRFTGRSPSNSRSVGLRWQSVLDTVGLRRPSGLVPLIDSPLGASPLRFCSRRFPFVFPLCRAREGHATSMSIKKRFRGYLGDPRRSVGKPHGVGIGSAVESLRAHSSIGQSPRLINGMFLVRTQVGPSSLPPQELEK